MSSVNLKLRDLAATLVPHMMNFAETGHWKMPPEDTEATSVEMDSEDYPDEINVEALHVLIDYLSHQWIPSTVKPAYDEIVKNLHYDS